jgi:hypothetical protein
MAATILADKTVIKHRSRAQNARRQTLGQRLEAKATAADRADFSGPSLGEMSREQRHKLLYGE